MELEKIIFVISSIIWIIWFIISLKIFRKFFFWQIIQESLFSNQVHSFSIEHLWTYVIRYKWPNRSIIPTFYKPILSHHNDVIVISSIWWMNGQVVGIDGYARSAKYKFFAQPGQYGISYQIQKSHSLQKKIQYTIATAASKILPHIIKEYDITHYRWQIRESISLTSIIISFLGMIVSISLFTLGIVGYAMPMKTINFLTSQESTNNSWYYIQYIDSIPHEEKMNILIKTYIPDATQWQKDIIKQALSWINEEERNHIIQLLTPEIEQIK